MRHTDSSRTAEIPHALGPSAATEVVEAHREERMREDLPCEEPLPKLWSICLAAGGDIVDAGPCLEDFDQLEPLELGGATRCWRVRGSDGTHHVLCETRFIVPERFAVPQLGRLRELLLREARLLDTLSHSCVVPLESGWLEQRTGFEDNAMAVPEGGCSPQSGALPIAAMGSASGGNACCVDLSSNIQFSVSSDGGSPGEENDVASFLLRSWVPLTLEDVDDDENDALEDEGGELAKSNKGISNTGSRNSLQYGGLEQLRWGGDDKTDWRGTAEPKSTAHRTTSTTGFLTAEKLLERKAPENFTTIGEGLCYGACGGRLSTNDGGGGEFPVRRRERTLSLASYLLLPDWIPLSVWFATEFEPRAASSDAQGGAATTRAVTAPHEWALVWRHLLSMFVQVVRGVEHLHTQGLIHNNVSPSSVWVATDGRCCVGNLSQAAPPGYRRPPPRAGTNATGHHHFASPERRQGRRVEAKSDLYSLGVLMLEFWRNYTLCRGLEELCLVGDDGLVERTMSGQATTQPDDGGGVLDAALVRSMLAEDPFDRPDCFEVIDSLDES